ncbi:methyltransferase [Bacillus tropicus]|nr:methyltransferase [Bacillus tropicus]
MQKFNEMIANDLHLQSVLMPIGDGMTVSRVK